MYKIPNQPPSTKYVSFYMKINKRNKKKIMYGTYIQCVPGSRGVIAVNSFEIQFNILGLGPGLVGKEF